MHKRKRFATFAIATLLGCCQTTAAMAEASYIGGHIIDFTFPGDFVLIRLDSGMPTNCAGSPYGWMRIPATNKAAQGLALGLHLRGDASTTPVTVYTSGIDASSFCLVNQIDPAS